MVRCARVGFIGLALLAASCAQEIELFAYGNGELCERDDDCDPDDSCSQGVCGGQYLSWGGFTVAPSSFTLPVATGETPRAVWFDLSESSRLGHVFDVACDGDARSSPESGMVTSAEPVRLWIRAPAQAAAGRKKIGCQVTSIMDPKAKADFTLVLDVRAGAPQPDFSIAVDPTALSLAGGGTASASVAASGTGGFSGTVALSATGLPAGATASFDPASIAAGATSSLTIRAGTAAAGTYQLTIAGTSGSTQKTAALSLTIAESTGDADFTMAANPAYLTLDPNASGKSTVSIAGVAGFDGQVALSISGLPQGSSAGFNPTTVGAGGSSTLTVAAGNAAAGAYRATIIGTSGAITHTALFELSIASGNGGGVGPNGGRVDLLDFVLTGDTRPGHCNDTANYPSAILKTIVKEMGKLNPHFGLDLGDHMFACRQDEAAARAQMNLYVQGLAGFPAIFFMTMGNHECENGKDCSTNQGDVNYVQYMRALRDVSKKDLPYYSLNIETRLGRVALVVVADKYFDSTAQAWLERTLTEADARAKYTIVAKHYPLTGSRQGPPGVANLIKSHKYSLILTAHNHNYFHERVEYAGRHVICGLGGANPSHTGFCRVTQAADGQFKFTRYDIDGNPGDTWAVGPQ